MSDNILHMNTEQSEIYETQQTIFVSPYYSGGPVWLHIINEDGSARAVLNADECDQLIAALKQAKKMIGKEYAA